MYHIPQVVFVGAWLCMPLWDLKLRVYSCQQERLLVWGRAAGPSDGSAAESDGHIDFKGKPSIPLDRIHVSSVHNFWQAVRATVAAGTSLASGGMEAAHPETNSTEPDMERMRLALDLKGCVIILPRPGAQVSTPGSSWCCKYAHIGEQITSNHTSNLPIFI